MAKVVTFGEFLMRLTPPGYQRLEQASSFEIQFGGAEANVAAGLTRMGLNCDYVTKLPQNAIGDAALGALRRYGIGVSKIVRGGERIGLYYLERGAAQRSSQVIYDRANSAFARAKETDFDWDSIFAPDTEYFVFTGISPALSDTQVKIAKAALEAAKARHITICCDVNYRAKLWDTKRAGSVMSQLLQYVDLCIVNEEHAKLLFGIVPSHEYVDGDNIREEGYIQICNQMIERFGIKTAAITIRRTVSANDNYFSAMLFSGAQMAFSRRYRIPIVDRIGSGDAFAAGLIYALDSKKPLLDAVEFATAGAVLAHSVEGDFPLISREEIENLAAYGAGGRTQR